MSGPSEDDIRDDVLAAIRASDRPISSVGIQAEIRAKHKGVESPECYRAAYDLVAKGLVEPLIWMGKACFQVKRGMSAQ